MSPSVSLPFTNDDYLLTSKDRRYEIIDEDLVMTPAPGTIHQHAEE